MKFIDIGGVRIPLDSYVISGTAILGIKGAGKTWTAKGIAEQLLLHKVPIVVFDAIGTWKYLKVAGNGAHGKGFKVVVAGGEDADLPLSPQSAPAIVRAAIKENIPLVIDLYDRHLSKADWRRIVQHSFRTLLYENTGARHIFLEEAAEFAPQKVMDGETYAEVEKLVRMGGNKSLGITLINQRAQELNKAVLDLCDNLVLMRQRGAHAIGAIEKWIDKLEPEVAKQVAAEMPHMGAGDAWVFTGGAENAQRVHVGALRTFHPDRSKPKLGPRAQKARTSDTHDFVSRLSGELAKLIATAKENDPAELKKRIKELEAQLKKGAQYQAAPNFTAAHNAAKHEFERGAAAERKQLEVQLKQWLPSLQDQISKVLDRVVLGIKLPKRLGKAVRLPAAPMVPAVLPRKPPKPIEALAVDGRKTTVHPVIDGDIKIDKCGRGILAVLANQSEGAEIGKLALLSGYRITGGFKNSLTDLRKAGYMVGENTGVMQITSAGLAQGPFEQMATGDLNYWRTNRIFGICERKIIDALAEHREGLNIEDLASATGYRITGGFKNSLTDIRKAGVMVGKNTEVMRLAPDIN